MQYLFQQGIRDTQSIFSFLYPSVHDFHNPFLLQDMRNAVSRIGRAIENGEQILVFGDYDADGITATTMLLKCLQDFGANTSFRIPFKEEGYGLSASIVHQLPCTTGLIITVDNGTTCHEALVAATRRGIDVIVTDHHEVTQGVPNCLAFINPKRGDNTYPCSHLSGAGVAFKLIHALHLSFKTNWAIHYRKYIELAAIGTIADSVPLTGENRTICKLALEKMNLSPSEQFRGLFKLLNVDKISTNTISHQIAPLINAQGRLDDPNKAVELLVNECHAHELNALIQLNEKRKRINMVLYNLCEEAVLNQELYKQPIVTLYGNYQRGCMGSIACKISKKFRKPTIIVGENGSGSARSVFTPKFSVLNVLRSCKEHLVKVGGHHCAAGFSIKPSEAKIAKFFAAIQSSAKIEECSPSPRWYFTTQSLNECQEELCEGLLMLEPFGKNFSQPIFLSPGLSIKDARTFGANNEHALLITNSHKKLYFYHNASVVQSFESRTKEFFYTSMLNGENDFLIHAINM